MIIKLIYFRNLPLNDPSNIPDPYVKLYLLPDRAKDSKRKTEVIANCLPLINSNKYMLYKSNI